MKQNPQEETYELVNDAKVSEIIVSVPRLKDKEPEPYLLDNTVYFGIGDIRDIGLSSLNNIMKGIDKAEEEAGVPAESWAWLDFLLIFSQYASSSACGAIISSGGVDYFGEQRAKMLYDLGQYKSLTKKEKEWVVEEYLANGANQLGEILEKCAKAKKDGGGCANKNRIAKLNGIVSLLKNPPHSLDDNADMIAWLEGKYLGTALTCSKVDGCDDAIHANTMCVEIVNGKVGYCVLAVEIKRVTETKTRNGKNPGQKMAFIGVSDSTCFLDSLVVFPEAWREFSSLLYEDNTVLLRCGVKKDSIIVEKVKQI